MDTCAHQSRLPHVYTSSFKTFTSPLLDLTYTTDRARELMLKKKKKKQLLSTLFQGKEI